MRLNEFQRAWIALLKSGKTRKFRGALRDPERGAYCCLGVACKLANARIELEEADLISHPKIMQKLCLKSVEGRIDMAKVKPKWLHLFQKYPNYDLTDPSWQSLAGLNDGTKISHKTIGQFIDENREAVFN